MTFQLRHLLTARTAPGLPAIDAALAEALADQRLSREETVLLERASHNPILSAAERDRLRAFLALPTEARQAVWEAYQSDQQIDEDEARSILRGGGGMLPLTLRAALQGFVTTPEASLLLEARSLPADVYERFIELSLPDRGARAAAVRLLARPAPIGSDAMLNALREGLADDDREAAGAEYEVFAAIIDHFRHRFSPEALRLFAFYERSVARAKLEGHRAIDTDQLIVDMAALPPTPAYRDVSAGQAIDALLEGARPIRAEAVKDAILRGTEDPDGQRPLSELDDFHDFATVYHQELTPLARRYLRAYFQLAVARRYRGMEGPSDADLIARWEKLGTERPDGSIDLPDPAPLNQDSHLELRTLDGKLFINGVSVTDVTQGRIGDCYLCAAVGAVAHTHPQLLAKVVVDNRDGTYTVNFRRGRHEEAITVDADLYTRFDGTPYYGSTLLDRSSLEGMELWFAILEKAYAQWKGSYEDIGNGGYTGEVMTALTGARSYYTTTRNPEQLWTQLSYAVHKGYPITMSTHGQEREDLYRGSGLSAWHAYTVLGVETAPDGTRYVHMRNPWGHTEPGNDGKNDGIFRLTLADAAKYFRGADINRFEA